jgi:fumarate reductase flavoprotein subunit
LRLRWCRKREERVPEVIVVGGGLAGLVAANRAAQPGRRVTLIESGAGDDYPCNSRFATGVINFAHASPYLPPEQLVRAALADTEGHGDPDLFLAFASVIGEGLTWLEREGAHYQQRTVQDKQTVLLSPPRSFEPGLDWQDRGPDVLLRRLAANLRSRGGETLLGTRATALAMREGRCVGVLAEAKDGGQVLEAGAVVIADGGFQANADLVRRHICARPEALVQRSAGTGRGEGIRMAAAVGARLVDMDRFYGHLLSRAAFANPRLWPYPTLDGLAGGGIVVDRAGRRVVDEGLGGITLSNRIAALEDPLATVVIFDEEVWTTTGRDEVVPPNPHLREAGGELYVADDLPGLAERVGLPAAALVETVAQFNTAVREGRADRLDPPRSPGRRFGVNRGAPDRIPPRPLLRPPFYAAPLAVGISCTMGGIAIDTVCRAQRADGGGTIPGLYAAGSSIGGIEGGPIAGYIGGLARAIATGLIAGDHVAGVKRAVNAPTAVTGVGSGQGGDFRRASM